MKKIFKVFIGGLIVLAVLFSSFVMKAQAWQKDSGANCERVFASIKNEEGQRDWKGRVKANNVAVVQTSGTAQSGEWVTVEWTPPANFVGTVEARVRLFNGNDVADQTEIIAELNCKSDETPTPTPPGCRPTAVKGCETPTPTEPPKHEDQGGGTGQPNPNCEALVPNNVGNAWPDFSRFKSEGIVVVNWVPVLGAQQVDIQYGPKDGQWDYSAVGLGNGGSAEIKGLDSSHSWWFRVRGVQGCASGNWSISFDP